MKQDELTVSQIKAMHFANDALMLSPYPLYRYEYKGDRFYYYIDPNEGNFEIKEGKTITYNPPVHFAVGVTTLTRRTIPQNEGLVKWIANMGYDAAIAYRDQRAKYGSLMHTCYATMLIKKVFNLDLLPEVVHNYCAVNKLVVNEGVWVDDLKQDLLAFATFLHEYQVKPLAIELSLASPRLGVAGTQDLFCEMDFEEKGYFGEVYASGINKGQPKETKRIVRTLAIVDFKSGRDTTGGIHNAAQLAALKMIFKDNYPTHANRDIRLYNFHPKDWRKVPTYTLVDQSQGFSEAAVMNIIGLYHEFEPAPEDKTVVEMFGVINLDQPGGENFTTKVIKEVVQEAVDNSKYAEQTYDYADFYFDPVEDEGSGT
jgi:hypothetical protein